MTSSNTSKFVIGLNVGTVVSSASIAHVDDPFNIFTITYWEDVQKKSSKNHQEFFSSIMYNDDSTITCGGDPETTAGSGYIPNIGQYLFDIDNANEKLSKIIDDLTIQKVFTDYLENFIVLALERFKVHATFTKSGHFKDFDAENPSNIRYCFVCPESPASNREFVKECFIRSQVIEEHEIEYRLNFATEAETIAYHQLSLSVQSTNMAVGDNFLVCNVGEVAFEVARSHVETTESFSTVNSISDFTRPGSLALEKKLREYLEDNANAFNLDSFKVDELVTVFTKKLKLDFNISEPDQAAFGLTDVDGDLIGITVNDLNQNVFMPFVENIVQCMKSSDQLNADCRILLTGKYGHDSYFSEYLTEKYGAKFTNVVTQVEVTHDAISSGAVSLGLHANTLQIPYLKILDKTIEENDLDDTQKNNNGNDGYDFIVGLDFGTTYSGCSYVNLEDETKTIKTIREWPGGNTNVFGKIPTLLMYDKKMKPLYWGEEARAKVNHNRDLTLLGNFKLFLCPTSLDQFYGAGNGNIEDIRARGGYAKNKILATKVITDYLKEFKKYATEYIISTEKNIKFTRWNRSKLLKQYKFRYAITVPAMWNSSARETMAQTAIDAGIIAKNELGRLIIISEPEAAALFCENQFTEYLGASGKELNGMKFILCDSGGGTVDLVTFQLTITEREDIEGKKFNETMICQIGDGVGDTCGSAYLDLQFKKYILNFYKDVGVSVDTTKLNLDDVMNTFVTNHKLHFMPNYTSETYFNIDLPGQGIINFNQAKNYTLINDNTTLRMKNDDMKNIVFDPIVTRIINLINIQREQAKKDGQEIDAIVMVGGFSRSPYLQQRIRDEYKGVCTVTIPPEGVTAISHGAVSYAMNPRMISKRCAAQSLGLEVQAPLEITDQKNMVENKETGPGGIEYVKSRLQYFVQKKKKLDGEKRKVYTTKVQVEYPNDAVFAIFSCDHVSDAFSRFITRNHTKIMEKRIILPSVTGINEGELIEFKVSLQMEHIGVTVNIACQHDLINTEAQRRTGKPLVIRDTCTLNVAKCKKPLIEYSLANTGYLFEMKRPVN